MKQLVIIAHNIRSTHNVGSLLRTAEGIGVTKVYLTGYTPYPLQNNDQRLPHIANKLESQIQKTALNAQNMIDWSYEAEIIDLLQELRKEEYKIIGLEQTDDSIPLISFKAPEKLALLLGSEVEGIDPKLIKLTDSCVEIPMHGKKESFNVVIAAAIAMYHCMLH